MKLFLMAHITVEFSILFLITFIVAASIHTSVRDPLHCTFTQSVNCSVKHFNSTKTNQQWNTDN